MQIFSAFPFLFMIFFSTTFSPGAGLDGVKDLRYLFARFYLWCRVPGVSDRMEGCPAHDRLMGYSILTGCLGFILFVIFQTVRYALYTLKRGAQVSARREVEGKEEFQLIQNEIFRNKAPVEMQTLNVVTTGGPDMMANL